MSQIQVSVGEQTYNFGPETTVTIGRSKEAAVSIDDKTVSRQHGDLRFETSVNAWVYTDLASGNGSYINGVSIMNTALTLPSEIKLGEQDDAVTISVVEAAVATASATCGKCASAINASFGPRCPGCDTLIHRNCWEANNGCTNPACSAKGSN